MNKSILFLGAGSAAEAIISGIIKGKVVSNNQLFVTNRENEERLSYLQERYQVICSRHKEELISKADIIILAMKPNDLEKSILPIKALFKENQLIISILAGKSTDKITDLIGLPIPVIRAMPNTSASIGYAATALTKGKYAIEQHMIQAKQLFQTIGMTTIVKEDDMHAITAISGSGPAYIYYLVEALEKAAIEAGLSSSVARELITQTVIGAGNMLRLSGEDPETLRQKITSPNGTTEAGISILENNHFRRIVMECVKGAKERSEELGNGQ
ncbi:pyrroline-5-carboxylate reductase [Oceanobacillus bengalensis]|uniref:pyrroline-5-carboxylate reductase n=1 Tax=Oceanobacillus bengalensis TaxID=1435466 RepID=UPI003634E9BE